MTPILMLLAIVLVVAIAVAMWAGYNAWRQRAAAASDLAPGVKPYWKRQRG